MKWPRFKIEQLEVIRHPQFFGYHVRGLGMPKGFEWDVYAFSFAVDKRRWGKRGFRKKVMRRIYRKLRAHHHKRWAPAAKQMADEIDKDILRRIREEAEQRSQKG